MGGIARDTYTLPILCINNENILYSTRNLLNTLWGPEQEGTQNGGDT